MQGSSNNSFIPKRNTSKRLRKKPARKIFLLTIVSYTALFASLIAAGGVYLYQDYTSGQLETEVTLLNTAIDTFSVRDFKRVQEFDLTLKQTKDRLANSASLVSVLEQLDINAVRPIQIKTVAMNRVSDDYYNVSVSFITETLDAALFQRKILNSNDLNFTNLTVTELSIQTTESDDPEVTSEPGVTFLAEFQVPVANMLYNPAKIRRSDAGAGVGQSAIQTQEVISFTDPVNTNLEAVDEEFSEVENPVFEDNENNI